jgi:hypothetical protein
MLIGSLIFLAISLRYPWTPHEIGWDSYFIHGLVNSLNHSGNFSSWWVHPLSPFGLTPFSYASAVPFILSAFSQTSGLSIESSIWLFGVICGLLGIFGSYLVAKEVFKDERYIFLVVFGFTTSQIFLGYTTWTLTTRGFFITILPYFLFLLFRNSRSRGYNKYSILVILFFIFLVSIHHLYTFLMFPILSYFIIKEINLSERFKRINNNKKFNLRRKINIFFIVWICLIIILFLFDILPTIDITNQNSRIYDSKFDWLIDMIKLYARQLGILGLFGIIGFFYLLYKYNKSLNEILLIFFVLGLIPFITIIFYMPAFIAIFIYLLAGFGLYFIGMGIYKIKPGKISFLVIIIILIISLTFSYIYQTRVPDIDAETEYDEIYMEEENYDVGLWLKYSTNDSAIYSNNIYPLKRIAGVMNLKQFPGSGIEQVTHEYIFINDYNVTLLSPFDPYFWTETYYETDPHQSALNWKASGLRKQIYSSEYSKELIQKYNLKYVLEDEQVLNNDKSKHNTFFKSLNANRFKMYSNQEYSVWYLY